MDTSINTKPLLEKSDSESENSEINENTSVKTFIIRIPFDTNHASFLIFYLLGMTTLFPWNFFITADNYWMYKLRDTKNQTSTDHRTTLQVEFTSYLSIASTVPSTLFLILNTFLSKRISLQLRMMGSLVSMLILFIITTVFVNIDTDSWQLQFFIITLLIVVVLNIASSILCGGLYGIAGKFPPKYISAIVSGQALGGIFAAIAEIVSLSLGASPVHSALFYFIIADATILLSLVSYMILNENNFFRYYIEIDKSPIESTNEVQISYTNVFKKIWPYCYSEWLVFVVSFAVFPSVTVLVESENKGQGYKWNDIYFVPVICYLIFNIADYLGRILAGLFHRPRDKPWLVALLSTARIVFVPLIMYSNVHPRSHLPVLIASDAAYICIMCAFALSNGYLANLSMMCTPRLVEDHEKETASAIIASFLGIGLATGSALSMLMVKLI